MNEKERIIDLVRQNIISMDEALDLLEAAGQKEETIEAEDLTAVEEAPTTHQTPETDSDTTTEETKKETHSEDRVLDMVDEMLTRGFGYARSVTDYFTDELKSDKEKTSTDEDATDYYTNEYQEAQQEAEESVEQEANKEPSEAEAKAARDILNKRIDEIKVEMTEVGETLDKKREALTIAHQRHRELEIFAELDDLTDEMAEQANKLTLRQSELEAEIATLEGRLTELENEQKRLYKEHATKYTTDFKKFINENAEKYSHTARDFGADMAEEGKNFGRAVKRNVRDFVKNFNMKDVNFSLQVPWIKSGILEHRFEYDAKDIDFIDILVRNGSLSVQSHDSDTIIIESDIRFYGNHEEISVDHFLDLSTVSADEKKFIFHVTSPRIAMDATVYLPNKLINYVKYNLTNGDLELSNLIMKDGRLSNKNGDILLTNVTGDMVQIDSTNGDIVLKDSDIQSVDVNNVNGDIRFVGEVNDVVVNTVNSDVFVTKKNDTDANLRLTSVFGDIKVAIPNTTNFDAWVEVASGGVKNRLANSTDDSTENKRQHIQRQQGTDKAMVQLEVKLNHGDVFLKDTTAPTNIKTEE